MLDVSKLPDLVLNDENQKDFNAVTDSMSITPPEAENVTSDNGEFKGITDSLSERLSTPITPGNTELQSEAVVPVRPKDIEVLHDAVHNATEIATSAPVGHDTATTDEEEAVEALLSLSNLPDLDHSNQLSDDNAILMPIGRPSTSIDVNPMKVKLGMDDVNQAIEQLAPENRMITTPPTATPGDNGDSANTSPQPCEQ